MRIATNSFFGWIETIHLPYIVLAGVAYALTLLRSVLEYFAYQNFEGFYVSAVFFHFPLFYFTAVSGVVAILGFMTPIEFDKRLRLCWLAFVIILLPPLIDTIFFGFRNISITYLHGSAGDLLRSYLLLIWPPLTPGASWGLFTEALILAAGIYFYARYQNLSRLKSGLLVWIIYSWVFVLAAFPAFLNTQPVVGHVQIQKQIEYSVQEILRQEGLSQSQAVPVSTEKGMLKDTFYFYLSLLFLITVAGNIFREKKEWLRMFFRHFPYSRLSYYVFLFLWGTWLLQKNSVVLWSHAWMALSAPTVLFVGAVAQNHFYDRAFSESGFLKPFAYGCFGCGLLLAYAISIPFLVLALALVLFSLIYDAPPLRLKRFFWGELLLLTSLALLALLMPAFINPRSFNWSVYIPTLIFLAVFLPILINLKDLKDYEADRVAGIRTLTVLWGREKMTRLIAAVIPMSYLVFVWLFLSPTSLVYTIPYAGLIGYGYWQNRLTDRQVIYGYILFGLGHFIWLR